MQYAFALLLGPGQTEISRLRALMQSLITNQSGLADHAHFVIINDGNSMLAQLHDLYSQFRTVHEIPNPLNGKSQVLFDRHMAGMLAGFRFIAKTLNADFVVKLDTDVLCISPFAERIFGFFAANPDVGLAGTYLNWPAGGSRQAVFDEWSSRVRNVHRKSFIRNAAITFANARWPSVRCHFIRRQAFASALKNGYRYGENAMGGSYAVSGALIQRWQALRYLRFPELFERSYLGEDIVTSMLVYAAGLKLGSFNRPGEVFGVWYRQPELAAAELHQLGYSLIHSIKAATPEAELELRGSFSKYVSGP